MNAIDKYQDTKYALQKFEGWAALIGKEYFGGTRGRGGEYGKVVSASGKMEIYHQAYDGANNYHSVPVEGLLGQAMMNKSSILIEEMRRILQNEVAKAKEEAKKLAEEIVN